MPFYLLTIYRPPRHSVATFTAVFDQLSEVLENHPCIITGDFNAKHSDWKASDETDSNGRALHLTFMKIWD